MANTRRTRAYRGGNRRTSGGNKRTSGSGALMDTVKSTFTQITGNRGNRGRGSRGRSSRGGGGLASQASGFVSGLLSGGGNNKRSRGRRRR